MMEIGTRVYEGCENFEALQLEMALTCDAQGWCMEDGYDEETGVRYLIINPPEVIPEEDIFEAAKQEMLAKVDSWTARQIVGGFDSEITGFKVRYDSDKDTQLTMQGIALNVNSERFANEYPDGCPVRGYRWVDVEENGEVVSKPSKVKEIFMFSPEQVMSWQADLSVHIGTCKQYGWYYQNAVEQCTTIEELEAIVLQRL